MPGQKEAQSESSGVIRTKGPSIKLRLDQSAKASTPEAAQQGLNFFGKKVCILPISKPLIVFWIHSRVTVDFNMSHYCIESM